METKNFKISIESISCFCMTAFLLTTSIMAYKNADFRNFVLHIAEQPKLRIV